MSLEKHIRLIENLTQDSDPSSTGNRTSRMNIFFSFLAQARNKALIGALSSFVFIPTLAYAGAFSFLGGLSFGQTAHNSANTNYNSQNINLLQVSLDEQRSPDTLALGGPQVTISNDGSLVSEFSPSSADYEIADITSSSGQIAIYTVQSGDTISEIAERYGISTNTIKWANGIKKGDSISIGQELVLLPITGIQVEVQKGDTISEIASRYHSDAEEIANYNGFTVDESLAVGEKLIIPDGELGAEEVKIAAKSAFPKSEADHDHTEEVSETKPSTPSSSTLAKRKELEAYFIRPVDGVVTQRFHGPHEAFDIGNDIGTPVVAMADGIVVLSKDSGWNGGYGQYIVIKHSNGTQTLYAHLSANTVSQGQRVTQGQKIGELGNTGRSTGPHLHFEVRGDPDPVPTPILY